MGFLCMTVKSVKKYLAPSPATAKGRMKRPQTGIRSTTKQKQQREKIREEPIIDKEDATELNFTVPVERHVTPDDNLVSNVSCFAALTDKNKSTLYTDATGALPVGSIDNIQY